MSIIALESTMWYLFKYIKLYLFPITFTIVNSLYISTYLAIVYAHEKMSLFGGFCR